jgi:hypothetical protein
MAAAESATRHGCSAARAIGDTTRETIGSTKEGGMRYALFVCADESEELSEEEVQARWTAFMRFQEDMEARGALVTLQRLQPTSTATKVRKRGGGLVVADGPFAETREQIAGFYVLECEDLDEALEFAARNPAAEFGTVEVRPVWVG